MIQIDQIMHSGQSEFQKVELVRSLRFGKVRIAGSVDACALRPSADAGQCTTQEQKLQCL